MTVNLLVSTIINSFRITYRYVRIGDRDGDNFYKDSLVLIQLVTIFDRL